MGAKIIDERAAADAKKLLTDSDFQSCANFQSCESRIGGRGGNDE
ncbi:MAG: hypothetical protein ACR2P5_08220 [Gammaproteobacteria bacterium]